MPTTRVFTPQRILPLVLAIPLLLLLGAAEVRRPLDPVPLYHTVIPIQFERHDLPAGWGDDVIQDALPPAPLTEDENGRRPCVARLVLEFVLSTAAWFLRTGRATALCPALESLTESLLASRPPPLSPAAG